MGKTGAPDQMAMVAATGKEDMSNVKLGISPLAGALGTVTLPLTFLCSWWVMNPREEAVVLNFGVTTDRVKGEGCHYNNCWGREILKISTAQITYDMPKQKITDLRGNPVLCSTILTYRFVDSTAALLNVTDARSYVQVQAMAAVKEIVGKFSYDELKTESDRISEEISELLQPRVNVCGAQILRVTLNELNYAPEIASAMLKKQQAAALIEARHLIVRGAVDIAQTAVGDLTTNGMELDTKDKVKIVTNILTVTCGEQDASPVLTL